MTPKKVTHIAHTRSRGKVEFQAVPGAEARRIANGDFHTGSFWVKCPTDGCQGAASQQWDGLCEDCGFETSSAMYGVASIARRADISMEAVRHFLTVRGIGQREGRFTFTSDEALKITKALERGR